MNTLTTASLSLAVVLATALVTVSSFAQTPTAAPDMQKVTAQSPWTRTTNNPPVNLGATLLLTDGTVIAHELWVMSEMPTAPRYITWVFTRPVKPTAMVLWPWVATVENVAGGDVGKAGDGIVGCVL